MRLLLAGDIGGTKTILRLVDDHDGEQHLLHQQRYASPSYPSLDPIVQDFLTQAQQTLDRDPSPSAACFAIAGPVVNQRAKLTNLPWQLDAQQLEQSLKIAKVELINDFSAVGYGCINLPAEDLHTLQAGERQEHGPIAVIGAGTGLGQGYLIWGGDHYHVYPSEGGHADFAPRSELEFGLLTYLQKRYGRISVERVVSGQGIVSIYQYLRDSDYASTLDPASGSSQSELGQAVQTWESQPEGEKTLDPAAMISEAALNHSDPLAEKTMEMFVSLYGSEVGNLGLKLLSTGGIYVAGGIAAKILPLLQSGPFLDSLLDKGRLSSVLKMMPIQIVQNTEVGLIGAASYAGTL